MCSIPDPPEPPPIAGTPSEVGKSAAGSVATPKKRVRRDSNVRSLLAPLGNGASTQPQQPGIAALARYISGLQMNQTGTS